MQWKCRGCLHKPFLVAMKEYIHPKAPVKEAEEQIPSRQSVSLESPTSFVFLLRLRHGQIDVLSPKAARRAASSNRAPKRASIS